VRDTLGRDAVMAPTALRAWIRAVRFIPLGSYLASGRDQGLWMSITRSTPLPLHRLSFPPADCDRPGREPHTSRSESDHCEDSGTSKSILLCRKGRSTVVTLGGNNDRMPESGSSGFTRVPSVPTIVTWWMPPK